MPSEVSPAPWNLLWKREGNIPKPLLSETKDKRKKTPDLTGRGNPNVLAHGPIIRVLRYGASPNHSSRQQTRITIGRDIPIDTKDLPICLFVVRMPFDLTLVRSPANNWICSRTCPRFCFPETTIFCGSLLFIVDLMACLHVTDLKSVLK